MDKAGHFLIVTFGNFFEVLVPQDFLRRIHGERPNVPGILFLGIAYGLFGQDFFRLIFRVIRFVCRSVGTWGESGDSDRVGEFDFGTGGYAPKGEDPARTHVIR